MKKACLNNVNKSSSFGVIAFILMTGLLGLELPLLGRASFIVILFLQIVTFLLVIPNLKFKINNKSKLIIIMLSLLSIWCVFSSFWSDLQFDTFIRSLYIFIPALMLIIIVYNDVSLKKTFWSLANYLSIIGLLLSIYGIVIYFFGDVVWLENVRHQVIKIGFLEFSQIVYGDNNALRISSITGNPNSLGLWLLICLIFTFSLKLSKRIKTKYFLFNYTICLFCLALTGSRAGVVSFFISLFLLVILYKIFVSAKVTYRTVMLVTITVSLLLIKFPFLLSTQIQGFLDQVLNRSSILTGRELVWRIAWDSFLENPILGLGFGVSAESLFYTRGIDLTAHNTYLSVLTEIGLVGLILVILLWVTPLFISPKTVLNQDTESKIIIITCVSLLIGLFFNQMFETKIPRNDFIFFIWIYLIGMLTNKGLLEKEKKIV